MVRAPRIFYPIVIIVYRFITYSDKYLLLFWIKCDRWCNLTRLTYGWLDNGTWSLKIPFIFTFNFRLRRHCNIFFCSPIPTISSIVASFAIIVTLVIFTMICFVFQLMVVMSSPLLPTPSLLTFLSSYLLRFTSIICSHSLPIFTPFIVKQGFLLFFDWQ